MTSTNFAGLLCKDVVEGLVGEVIGLLDAAGVGQEDLPGGGEAEFPAPLEKLKTQRLFQGRNLRTHRRLGKPQRLGRFGEIPLLFDLQKGPNFAILQHTIQKIRFLYAKIVNFVWNIKNCFYLCGVLLN